MGLLVAHYARPHTEILTVPISVLRTNARITPLQAVIRYRDLLQVEALFRVAKASFDTRPIFHQSDAAIRGKRSKSPTFS